MQPKMKTHVSPRQILYVIPKGYLLVTYYTFACRCHVTILSDHSFFNDSLHYGMLASEKIMLKKKNKYRSAFLFWLAYCSILSRSIDPCMPPLNPLFLCGKYSCPYESSNIWCAKANFYIFFFAYVRNAYFSFYTSILI